LGEAPRIRGRGSSWSEEEASRTTTVAIAASPKHLSPLSFLPPSPPPLMPPPPRPHPCLRRHYRCSLCRCHCVSNAPFDGWLWCRLSPLAYCVVRRPNISAPAIVRSSTLSPPGRRPLLLTIASHCPVNLLPSTNRFHLPLMVGCHILRPPSSIPITSPSRKCFQFPPSWTYFDLLLRVITCLVLERLQNLRGC
jgi:hypothetical protein